MRNRLREKIFVGSPIQVALVKRAILYWAAFTVFVAVLLAAIHSFARPDQGPWAHFLNVLLHHWPILLLSVAMLPLVIYDSIRFSHRLAGPMLRFHQELERHSQGEEIRPLHFRQNDFWKDLAEQINLLVNRVGDAEARVSAFRPSPKPKASVIAQGQKRRRGHRQLQIAEN